MRKRETILAEGLADRILSLYASGQSTRDITRFFEENYGTRVSPKTVSRITDRVLPEIQAWKGRPLESVYPVVWLDAVHYKVRNEGTIVTKAIYNVLAVDGDGHKELLGMYIGESEGARFWTEVLTNLKNRGVRDILIACVDGLKGFPEAISAIFPATDVQLCVVHQIRGSMRYVSYKDRREFMSDLKPVYRATTAGNAEIALGALEEKWGSKYPVVLRSWRANWQELSHYFAYTPEIRRLIYTTNMAGVITGNSAR